MITSNPSSGNEKPVELDESTIRDNLSCLGKHPFTMNHAYLALKAPSHNIGSITTIAKYPNLMYINLANNCIDDLTPLSSLPGLVELDVRNNKLHSCLDFAPQRCTSSSAWSSGQKAVGSMLTVAILSNNRITDMGDLTSHEFLECLVLSENLITKICGLQNLQYLQVLDLSYNRINRIEGLDGLLITELNLAGNHLVDVSGLQGLSRLSVLNIANNYIRSLGPLNECTQLHNVDAKDNDIGIIRQVEFLSDLPWMHYLELTGNPCCAKQYYRNRVVFRLPNLQMLDGTTISAEEKIRSNNIYGQLDEEKNTWTGGDLPYRQKVFNSKYPGEPFQNFSPYFEDDEMEMNVNNLYGDGLGEIYVSDAVRAAAHSLVRTVIVTTLSERENRD